MTVLAVLGGLLAVCAVVWGATHTPDRPPRYVGRHRAPEKGRR